MQWDCANTLITWEVDNNFVGSHDLSSSMIGVMLRERAYSDLVAFTYDPLSK